MKSNFSIVVPIVKLIHKSFICPFSIPSQHPMSLPMHVIDNEYYGLRQETIQDIYSVTELLELTRWFPRI